MVNYHYMVDHNDPYKNIKKESFPPQHIFVQKIMILFQLGFNEKKNLFARNAQNGRIMQTQNFNLRTESMKSAKSKLQKIESRLTNRPIPNVRTRSAKMYIFTE